MAFTEEELRAIYRQSVPTATIQSSSAPAYSEQQLREIYRSQQPQPEESQLTYGGEEPTTANLLMSGSQGYLRGLAKGATLLPGLAANIPTFVGGKIAEQFGAPPIEKYPTGYLDDVVDAGVTGLAGGYDARDTQSKGAKLLGTVTEFAGSSIAPAAQLQSISQAKQLPNVLKSVSGFLSKDPGLQVRAAGAAGVGKFVADELAPDSLAAQIAFPLMAGAGYGMSEQGIKSGLKFAQNKLRETFTVSGKEEKAKEAAKAIIDRYVTDPSKAVQSINAAEADIAKAPWIERQSPNFLPKYRTTAEVTQDPGIALLQQTTRQLDPDLNTQLTGVSDTREAARRAIMESARGTYAGAEQAGNTIRAGLQEQYAGLKEQVSNAAQKAFKGKDTIPVLKIKSALSDAVTNFSASGAREIDSEFMKYLNNFNQFTAKNKNRISLKDLRDYHSTFGKFADAARAPNATTTQRITAQLAGQVRDNIDEAIVSSSNTIPKSQKRALERMISLRKQQGATYEQGVVGDILERKPYGAGFDMASEAVAKAPIKTVDEMRQTLQALGNNSTGKQQLRAALIDDIWQRSTSPTTQALNPTQFSRQLKMARSVITELNATQRKALLSIEKDVISETSVPRNAYRAFERQSPTSPAQTAKDAVKEAIKQGAGFAANNSILGRLYSVVSTVVKDPQQQQLLINKELAKFAMNPRYAAQMMKPPTKSNVETLSTALVNSLVRSSIQSVRGSAQQLGQMEEQIKAMPASTTGSRPMGQTQQSGTRR